MLEKGAFLHGIEPDGDTCSGFVSTLRKISEIAEKPALEKSTAATLKKHQKDTGKRIQ